MRQAAKDVAPAAVEGSVNKAHQPEMRDQIADVLGDRRIRGATAELAQAVADGVLNSITEEERVGRAQAASDAFVEHMSGTLARSLQRDFAPALASLVADSVARSLDEKVEARIEAMARAAARGGIEGVADGWDTRLQQSGPALQGAVTQIARTAAREAALGFQDAVATSTAKQKAGAAPPGDVLAAAGRASDTLLVAMRLAGWLLVVAAVCVALSGIVWAVRRLRPPRSGAGRETPAHA